MTYVDCLDLHLQELGFVLKSEQSGALELPLRGKDVFCVLPTGFDKSFVVVLLLPLIFDPPLYILHFTIIHYISQTSNTKNCFRITGLQRQDSKPSADNNTRYSPSKSITECIKFTKRVELWTDFWQLDDMFEPPGQNELIVWKTNSRFFFYRLARGVFCALKTLMPRFTDFFTDFEKKTDCSAVYNNIMKKLFFTFFRSLFCW